MKSNQDYQFLLINGFTIDITSHHSGWSRMHLVKSGSRIDYISFRSNNINSARLLEKAPVVRPSTHLGKALAELKEIAMKHVAKTSGFTMVSGSITLNASNEVHDAVSVKQLDQGSHGVFILDNRAGILKDFAEASGVELQPAYFIDAVNCKSLEEAMKKFSDGSVGVGVSVGQLFFK